MRLIDGDELKTAFPPGETVKTECVRATIDHMPTIEPERKKGKWIMHLDALFPEESTMECDQCHAEQSLICDDNFCPACGADMNTKGEQK